MSLKPVEKLQKLGPKQLTPEELVSIILYTGIRNLSVFQLAKRVTPLLIEPHSTISELTEYLKAMGLNGTKKAVQLIALKELLTRYSNSTKIKIVSPQDIYRLFYFLTRKKREHLYILFLDPNLGYQKSLRLEKGDDSSLEIEATYIARLAYSQDAKYIILIHNHPSGNTYPSKEDIYTTTILKNQLTALGIHLVDHVIVTKNGYFSFKEHNLL